MRRERIFERRGEMKVLLRIVCAVMCLLAVASCDYREPLERRAKGDNTSEYDVRLLFEIDSVRVYRFMDAGHFVYFTSRGDTRCKYREGKVVYENQLISGETE